MKELRLLKEALEQPKLNANKINDLCYDIKHKIAPEDQSIQTDPNKWAVYKFFQPYDINVALDIIKRCIELYKNTFPEKEEIKFLDIGSGLGHICFIADKLGLKTTGLELSKGLLENAVHVSPNTEFLEQDITTFDKYDEYDLIWSFNPCGHPFDIAKFVTDQIKHPAIVVHLNTPIYHVNKDNWKRIELTFDFYKRCLINFEHKNTMVAGVGKL